MCEKDNYLPAVVVDILKAVLGKDVVAAVEILCVTGTENNLVVISVAEFVVFITVVEFFFVGLSVAVELTAGM